SGEPPSRFNCSCANQGRRRTVSNFGYQLLRLPVIGCARLLALTFGLTLLDRLLAPRVAALKGGSHLPLATNVYAFANVAIDCGGQRVSRRQNSAEAQNKHDGEKREQQAHNQYLHCYVKTSLLKSDPGNA